MRYVIDAENIKCGGCAGAIRDTLGRIGGVNNVVVEIDTGRVTVEAADGLREVLVSALSACGYPEKQS